MAAVNRYERETRCSSTEADPDRSSSILQTSGERLPGDVLYEQAMLAGEGRKDVLKVAAEVCDPRSSGCPCNRNRGPDPIREQEFLPEITPRIFKTCELHSSWFQAYAGYLQGDPFGNANPRKASLNREIGMRIRACSH